jgi:hypothetical protein
MSGHPFVSGFRLPSLQAPNLLAATVAATLATSYSNVALAQAPQKTEVL